MSGVPDLFYRGLAQPLPTPVNFAEQQAKLVAGMLTGSYVPPSAQEMHRTIAADEAYNLGQYYLSRRHTIQLDFDQYSRDLTKELARGAKRAGGVKRAWLKMMGYALFAHDFTLCRGPAADRFDRLPNLP